MLSIKQENAIAFLAAKVEAALPGESAGLIQLYDCCLHNPESMPYLRVIV
jgi:hypothetical protein